MLQAMKKAIGPNGIRMVSVRVNIGDISDHWSNTEAEGGRLLGEGVHFFDFCNWFLDAEPISVQAVAGGVPSITNPNAMIMIRYPDGSTAQVIYTTLGHANLGKEYFEAFGNGRTLRSDDYRSFEAFGISASVSRRRRGDKGQRGILEEFGAALRNQSYATPGADARAGLLSTWIARAAYQSAAQNTPVSFTLESQTVQELSDG